MSAHKEVTDIADRDSEHAVGDVTDILYALGADRVPAYAELEATGDTLPAPCTVKAHQKIGPVASENVNEIANVLCEESGANVDEVGLPAGLSAIWTHYCGGDIKTVITSYSVLLEAFLAGYYYAKDGK